MAIAFTNLGATANPDLFSGSSASSFTNTSFTPPTGLVELLVHSDLSSAGTVNRPTISGTNGWNLTWTFIVELKAVGSQQGQFLFATEAAGGAAGTITVDFGGQNQAGFASSLFYATGVDTSGGVAAAFVQTKTGTASGTASPSITLDSGAGNANNRCISYFYNNAGVGATPRTNWTEMDDWGAAGASRAVETQVRSDAFEQTASATPASGTPNWFMLMAELRAAPDSAIKTFDGLARASTKTVNGIAIASVKTWNGLA